jgi:acetyltransferase
MKTTTPSPRVKSNAPLEPVVGDLRGKTSPAPLLTVKGYGKLNLRSIHIDDEEEMIAFHKSISEESIYMRYFEFLGLDQRTAHDRLRKICTNTSESYAIVVESIATAAHDAAILAVGRLTTIEKPVVVSFDTLIVNEKKTGELAKPLLRRLVKLAKDFGFQTLTGELLVADHDALNVCRALGFTLHTVPEDGLVKVSLEL